MAVLQIILFVLAAFLAVRALLIASAAHRLRTLQLLQREKEATERAFEDLVQEPTATHPATTPGNAGNLRANPFSRPGHSADSPGSPSQGASDRRVA